MNSHVPMRAVEEAVSSAAELYLCTAITEDTVRDAIIGHISRKTGLIVELDPDPGMIPREELKGTAEGIDCRFEFQFSGGAVNVMYA